VTLDVTDLREHIETELEDSALERLLAAAYDQIDAVAGPTGELIEHHAGGSRFIILRRFAAEADSGGEQIEVREADAAAALDPATEWRILSDRRSIERLEPGCETCERRFFGPVEVIYVPRADDAIRDLVAIELVKGDVTSNPGVLGMTEGNWTIQYANGTTWSSSQAGALEAVAAPWSFA